MTEQNRGNASGFDLIRVEPDLWEVRWGKSVVARATTEAEARRKASSIADRISKD